MPIVVDEIVISVDLRSDAGGATPAPREQGGDGERQAMVAEVVERVLEVLAEREER